jgi:hypothetical protein
MGRAEVFVAVLGAFVLIGALSASSSSTSDASLGVLLGVALLVTSGLLRWRRSD